MRDRALLKASGPGKERVIAASLNDTALAAIAELEPELKRFSLDIHAHPELAFQEHHAVRQLTGWLGNQGFRIERNAGGLETAFTASHRLGTGGPRIAFIAEYDALPGIGHACGHNLICTAAIGAATAVVSALRDQGVSGEVLVIGTPAEEGGGGKITLIDAGVFEGIDAALMFHGGNRTMVTRGSLAATRVTMKFYGKAAHAASYPHAGINALDACIQTFNAINALRQHVRDETRIHGVITNGGLAPNIVPDYAEAKFSIRHRSFGYMQEVRDKVFAAARHAAQSVGASVELEEGVTYKERIINGTIARRFGAYLEEFGEEVKEPLKVGGVGSSDYGNLSHEVPAIHPYIQIVDAGISAHTAEFAEAAGSERGLRAMLLAARCLALTGIDLFTEPGLLADARTEFTEATEAAAEAA